MTPELREKLTKPFGWEDVEYRVVVTTQDKKRGQIAFYIDARAVMNRLDDAGCEWSDTFYVHQDGKHVECQLTVDGVTRADVGECNDGPGAADPMKSAYSDAFKRAAVKFGIGRYLHDQGRIWVDLDEHKQPKASEVQKIRAAYRRLENKQPALSDETVEELRESGTELRGGKMAETPKATNGAKPATSREISDWFAAVRELGLTNAKALEECGVSTLAGLTTADLDRMLAALKATKAAA